MAGELKVGFTGTSAGMSDTQRMSLAAMLHDPDITEFHHGDCVGADFEADGIARAYGIPIVIHPPTDPKAQAFCFQPGDRAMPRAPYLQRNHEIVDATDILLAAPRTDEEELRSGTWATVRYAQSIGRPVRHLLR